MPTGTILLLGAFAGLTIYLGLPLAFLKQTPQSLKIFLNMLATGVLLFLLFDVVSKASDPINIALNQVRTQHTGTCLFWVLRLAQWGLCMLIAPFLDGCVGTSRPQLWPRLWPKLCKERQEAAECWWKKERDQLAPLPC